MKVRNEAEEESQERLKALSLITRAVVEKPIGSCTEERKTGKWKCISLAVDSGACDNVIHPEDLPEYVDKVMETAASLKHEDFVSANGTPITNYGELTVPVVTREKTMRGITFQAAGVKKGLLSVDKMNESGHVVILDGDSSFIIHKVTGDVNRLRRDDGNFMLDVWVPPPNVAVAAGFRGQR